MTATGSGGTAAVLRLCGLLAAVAAFGPVATTAWAQDPGGDPDTRVPVPPAGKYFGLTDDAVGPMHGLSSQQFVDLADRAGANAIRATLDWRSIEPRRDGWSDATWARFDDFYARARSAGLTPVLTLAFAPRWARNVIGQLCLLDESSCLYPPRPEMYGEWAQFAAEAARRYPEAIFEIWNEPNLVSYWQSGPDPERYAHLQAVAYDAIKEVRPGATVLSAGFANVQRRDSLRDLLGSVLGRTSMREFVRRAYAAPDSLGAHTDALAFHPYPGPARSGYSGPPPDFDPDLPYAKGFNDLRAVRDAAGDGAKPLFVTETGVSTTDGVSRAEQAIAVRRLYNKTLTMDDVQGVVMHRIIEPSEFLVNPTEIGYAWLRQGPYPPRPWPVYCEFALAAGNEYPGC